MRGLQCRPGGVAMDDGLTSRDFDDVRRELGDVEVSRAIAAAVRVVAVNAEPYEWADGHTLPLRPWVYGSMWLRGCVGLVVAPGAVGKTAMLVGHALALASGRPLLGQTVWGGPKQVWYWNLEDGKDEMRRLVQAAAQVHGLTAADIQYRLFLNCGLDSEGLVITETDGRGFTIKRPIVDALVAELRAKGIDVLIVDPFVSSHCVPENDNGAIDMVAKKLARVAVAANCAIVLAHHTSKLQDGAASAERARGASALVNAARSAVALNRMSESEAGEWDIPAGEARRYIKAYDDKNNRAPPAGSCCWFYLKSEALNNGGLGGLHPGDNMQVIVPWQPPKASIEFSEDDIARVQEAIADGNWRESNQSPDWVGHAVASALGLDMQRPGTKKRIGQTVKKWLAQGYLQIEERKDGRSVLRPFIGVGKPCGSSPPLHPEVEKE